MLVIYWDYKIYSRITVMVYRDYKNYALGLQGFQGLQRQILRLHCDYKKNLWDYNKITKKKREDYKKITKKSVGIIIHYRQWIGHICSPASALQYIAQIFGWMYVCIVLK